LVGWQGGRFCCADSAQIINVPYIVHVLKPFGGGVPIHSPSMVNK